MKYTLRLGTYLGIPVRVHFTFPLILILFGGEAAVHGGWQEAISAVLLVISVFVCVVLHEFGHSLQVRRYGIDVRDIVLLPIGGMARAERIPENPRQEIIVAISGPLVNFGLALVLGGILWARREPAVFEDNFLVNLLSINLVLGTFNLIPAFPMDGGRILRGVLAMRMSYLSATRHARNVGQVIAILFVLLGFSFPRLIMLPLIAVFIFFGAISEERMVRVKAALGGKTARDLLPPNPVMLSNEASVGSVGPQVEVATAPLLPVTDRYGSLMGVVPTDEIRNALQRNMADERLDRFAIREIPLIAGDTSAVQSYYYMKTHKLPFAGIVDSGNYLGIVFLDDLARVVVAES